MEWLRKRLFWVLLIGVTVLSIVAAGIVGTGGSAHEPLTNSELADALGDQDDLFPSTAVTCVHKAGALRDGGSYSHRCVRVYYEGLCYPGTGETREIVFVRVRGRKYRVIREVSVGVFVECASVA